MIEPGNDDENQQTHSEADLATIVDVTMWHQMPHLPARRLIQLNCGRWPVWSLSHRNRVIEARRLDDSRDWYFPIITKKWTPRAGRTVPRELCSTWSGVWHESADHAVTDRVLTLPPMNYLGKDWRYASFVPCQIAASAGGLLLLWTRKELSPKRYSSRLSKPADAESYSFNESQYWEKSSTHWTRFLVCNPLTKEFRELPALTVEEIGRQPYNYSVLAHMAVDEVANSYLLILFLHNCVVLYKSTTNRWSCLRLRRQLRQRHYISTPCPFYRAGACVGASAYFADIKPIIRGERMDPVFDPTPADTLRLFHFDAESRRGRLSYEYTLRKFHLSILNQYPELFPFDLHVVNNVELVGCMGDLYAVVPARLYDVVTVGHKQTPLWKNELQNFDAPRPLKRKHRQSFELTDPKEMMTREMGVKYMPLVFYVMQLRSRDGVLGDGEGVDHAVLRIEVPTSIPGKEGCEDYVVRKRNMYRCTDASQSGGPNWFKSEARGSVIWVSYEDYLLSYDVRSRKRTAQIIPVTGTNSRNSTGTANHVACLAYRPSFHMKP